MDCFGCQPKKAGQFLRVTRSRLAKATHRSLREKTQNAEKSAKEQNSGRRSVSPR